MRYKLVIQALRESSDNNVLTFLKDVEKMNVGNLWEQLSSDFNLPVSERQFYQ